VKAPYANDRLYVAGETVTPGKFKCERCGRRLEIDHVTNLPVCPACQHDRWQGA
jgi:Zn finger protein HypA/HybF involved in hydrogenase expression